MGVWNILHTFMSLKLHVSKPEFKKIYICLCVGIKSSEKAQRSMLLKSYADWHYESQNCGSDEKIRLTSELRMFSFTDSTSTENEGYQQLFPLIVFSLWDEHVQSTQNLSMVENKFFTCGTSNPDRTVAVVRPTGNFWVFGCSCLLAISSLFLSIILMWRVVKTQNMPLFYKDSNNVE